VGIFMYERRYTETSASAVKRHSIHVKKEARHYVIIFSQRDSVDMLWSVSATHTLACTTSSASKMLTGVAGELCVSQEKTTFW